MIPVRKSLKAKRNAATGAYQSPGKPLAGTLRRHAYCPACQRWVAMDSYAPVKCQCKEVA